MSDVIGRIEKTISNCDHIRDEHLVSLLADAADEIERLREDRDDHKRMREHWWREAGREIANKAAVQHRLNEAYKRIEELEKKKARGLLKFAGTWMRDDQHIITTDQIREAWRKGAEFVVPLSWQLQEVMAELGIVRCECVKHGLTHGESGPCALCNGEGFKIGGEDE